MVHQTYSQHKPYLLDYDKILKIYIKSMILKRVLSRQDLNFSMNIPDAKRAQRRLTNTCLH